METIDPQKYYKPREIADAGWVQGVIGGKTKRTVQLLIKQGVIKAKRVGRGKINKYYLVAGTDILAYQQSLH